VRINEQIKIEKWEEYFRAMLNGSEEREEGRREKRGGGRRSERENEGGRRRRIERGRDKTR